MWIPTLKQIKILNSTHKYIDARGDPRSGKSEGFFHKAHDLLLEERGIKILMTRDTGTQLYTASFKHFLSVMEPNAIEPGGVTLRPYPIVRIKTGSEMHFQAFDEMDTTKAGSSEYAVIWMEEAHRGSVRQWVYFQRRLSQEFGNAIGPDGRVYRNRIKYRGLWTSRNAAGHNWCWQIFTRDHPDAEAGTDPKFLSIKFLMKDNEQNLPKDYVRDIEDLPPHMQKQYIGGEEEPEQGFVFPHFDRRIHVIPQRNLKLPWNWRIFFGLDHGYKNPTHGVWGAVNEDGFIIIFHEYRKSGLTIPENAANILGEEKSLEQSGIQAIEGGWVDPTTHMRDGKNASGMTTYEQYLHEGMKFLYLPSRLPVKDRVDMTARALIPRKNLQHHPITNEFRKDGWPKLMFTEDCPETIREHEEWEWPPVLTVKKDPSGSPMEKDDHGPDAVAYLLIGVGDFAVAPENEITVDLPKNNPNYWVQKAIETDLEDFEKKRRQMNRGRRVLR